MKALVKSRRFAAAVIAVGALAYPLALLAQGSPRFPTRSDCLVPATHDGNIQLLFGSFSGTAAANEFLKRVQSVGFTAQATLDSCGEIDVAVPGYTTIAGARSAVAEARKVSLTAKPVFAP